jgi:multidrug resistance efflux pump
MHTKVLLIRFSGLALLLLAVLALVGCNAVQPGQGQATAAPQPITRADDRVIAEGSLVPARWAQLAFQIPGTVDDVLVETGQRVAADELLIQLDREALELSVRSAEQDVLAQEAALRRLNKGATEAVINRADKANADQIAQAEVALEIKRLQLEQAEATDPELSVQAAQARLDQLERQVAQVRAQDPSASVDAAQIEVERAQIALDDVQDEYNKALDRPWEDQEIRDAWAKQLEQAQLNARAARANLEGALDARRAHNLSLRVLDAQIEEAKIALAQAEAARDSNDQTLATLAAEVAAAELNLAALKANDNPYRDPATEEELAQAEVLLSKAELAVETLSLQLEDTELRAPFAGTVVDVLVDPGDEVAPGQVVLVLATLDHLEAHTTDLTELDVANVAVGQPAEVRVDALPDSSFAGEVAEIALQAQDYRGDVVYRVIVALTEALDPALRWGMTTEVRIDTD